MNEPRKKEIQISIHFAKLGEIDSSNEYFNGTIMIQSRWIDNGLKSKRANSNNSLKYDANKNWNPKLYVENSTSRLEVKETTYLVKEENGDIYVIEKKTFEGMLKIQKS
jgi:hypothetical protein